MALLRRLTSKGSKQTEAEAPSRFIVLICFICCGFLLCLCCNYFSTNVTCQTPGVQVALELIILNPAILTAVTGPHAVSLWTFAQISPYDIKLSLAPPSFLGL